MAEEKDKPDDKKKKSGIFKYLDNTIGDEGLRTDVKITLTNDTLAKLIFAAVAASALSTITYFGLKRLMTGSYQTIIKQPIAYHS